MQPSGKAHDVTVEGHRSTVIVIYVAQEKTICYNLQKQHGKYGKYGKQGPHLFFPLLL